MGRNHRFLYPPLFGFVAVSLRLLANPHFVGYVLFVHWFVLFFERLKHFLFFSFFLYLYYIKYFPFVKGFLKNFFPFLMHFFNFFNSFFRKPLKNQGKIDEIYYSAIQSAESAMEQAKQQIHMI